jgi:Zn-finger nucleic acid-binding protein
MLRSWWDETLKLTAKTRRTKRNRQGPEAEGVRRTGQTKRKLFQRPYAQLSVTFARGARRTAHRTASWPCPRTQWYVRPAPENSRLRGESRLCPIDGDKLGKQVFEFVLIDKCPACGGVWLDKGGWRSFEKRLGIKCQSIVESQKCQSIREHSREATSRSIQRKGIRPYLPSLAEERCKSRVASDATCTALDLHCSGAIMKKGECPFGICKQC